MPFALLLSHLEFAMQEAALSPVADWAAQAIRVHAVAAAAM